MTRTSATRPVAQTALTSLAALAVLAGCTAPDAPPDTETPTPGTGEAEVRVDVSAPVTRVSGRLPDRDRLALRRQVEALLVDYLGVAFLDTDPDATGAELFPGFTEGAARMAARKGAVLTRAGLGDGPVTVEVVSAEAPLNVLAPRGRPAGATARLDVELAVTPADEPADEPADDPSDDPSDESAESGAEPAGPERVRLLGRFLLTPAGQGWRIFGFDAVRTER